MYDYAPFAPNRSGFPIFLPLLSIHYPHILFPDRHPPVLSSFLLRTVILRSQDLDRLCAASHWAPHDISLVRFVIGLHFQDIHLIQASLEALINSPSATKLFFYIHQYLQDGIKDTETLPDKQPFYKTLLYWVSGKFNEYLLTHKQGDQISSSFTRLQDNYYHELDPSTGQKHISEASTLVECQSGFKDLKHALKIEGTFPVPKERKSWKTKLHTAKLVRREPSHTGKNPIELLLKGRTSSLVYMLRPQGYSLARIQERIKHVSFFYLAQGHFSFEYASFLMEQVGIGLEAAFLEYYNRTLRGDIRKGVRRFLKSRGNLAMLAPETLAFLKLNEILAPVDSITIAKRRQYAQKPLMKPSTAVVPQRVQARYNLLEESGGIGLGEAQVERSGRKRVPESLGEFVGMMESFEAFTFEMDDFVGEEPGSLYMEGGYAMAKYFRYLGMEDAGDLETGKEDNGPFPLEGFKAYDRFMHEVNQKRSYSGKTRFKPKRYTRRREQLLRLFSAVVGHFFGKEVRVPEEVLEGVDLKDSGRYFQYKVEYMKAMTRNQMLGIALQRLGLGLVQLRRLFDGLDLGDSMKFLEFLVEYSLQLKDSEGLKTLLEWALNHIPQVFNGYLSVNNRVIEALPSTVISQSGYLTQTFLSFMVANGFSFKEGTISPSRYISLLASNRRFHSLALSSSHAASAITILDCMLHNGLTFTAIELFRYFNINPNQFLSSSTQTYKPLQEALVLALNREQSFGRIISLYEQEHGSESNPYFTDHATKQQKDLHWEYSLCHLKYSNPEGLLPSQAGTPSKLEKSSSSIFEMVKPGSIISSFLLEHISGSRDLFSDNMRLPVDEYFDFTRTAGPQTLGQTDTLQRRTKGICCLILFGLPFTAFLSIYGPYSPYDFLLGGDSSLQQQQPPVDMSTLREVLYSIKEPRQDPEKKGMVYEILKSCFQMLLRRPFDLCLFSSYLTFIKLLRIDVEFSLVNLSVYRRIFIHSFQRTYSRDLLETFALYHKQERIPRATQSDFDAISGFRPQENLEVTEPNEVPMRNMSTFHEIYLENLNECLGIDSKPPRKRGTHLIEVLQSLEQATISMESAMNHLKTMKEHAETTKEMESPWGLVSKFCRLYNIPSSLKLLDEISARDDWVKLLLELDNQQCSVETAREFINKYFHHAVLKRHLLNSLDVGSERGSTATVGSSSDRRSVQGLEEDVCGDVRREILDGLRTGDGGKGAVVGIMLSVRGILARRLEGVDVKGKEDVVRKALGKVFLEVGKASRLEVFCLFSALVGAEDAEVPYFMYLKIWKERLGLVEELRKVTEEDERVRDMVAWCCKDMEGLIALTKVCLGKKALLSFLKGISKARAGEYEAMQGQFMKFRERSLAEKEQNSHTAVEFDERFYSRLVRKLIETGRLSEPSSLRLLHSIHQLKISRTLEDWYINLNMIQRLKPKFSAKPHSHNPLSPHKLIFEPFELFVLLLEHEMFREANAFSQRYSFERSYLVHVQVHKLLSQVLSRHKEAEARTNHKPLIDSILVLLLQSRALVYQSVYYLRYLSSREGFTVWDQVYILIVSLRLVKQLPEARVKGSKIERFKRKLQMERNILVYSYFYRDMKREFFEQKTISIERTILRAEAARPVRDNISFSQNIELLVNRAYTSALYNYDYNFLEELTRVFGAFLQDKEPFIVYTLLEENLIGKELKTTLRELLEILEFDSELSVLTQHERRLKRVGDSGLDTGGPSAGQEDPEEKTMVQASRGIGKSDYTRRRDSHFSVFRRLRQLLGAHGSGNGIIEDLNAWLREYLCNCAAISLAEGKDDNVFAFYSVDEVFKFSKKFRLKHLFSLLLTAPSRHQAELLTVITFTVQRNEVPLHSFLNQYLDFAAEDLAALTETDSFIEKLNKIRRYSTFLCNTRLLSHVLTTPTIRLLVGRVCLNYLRVNPTPYWTKSSLLGLAYCCLSDSIEHRQYLQKAVRIARDYITELLGGFDRQPETVVDQVCVTLLNFEWRAELLWTLSEALAPNNKRNDLWKMIYESLGPEWGQQMIERVVGLGGSLPALEGKLKDAPLVLGDLIGMKAWVYMRTLVESLGVEKSFVSSLSMKGCLKLIEVGGYSREAVVSPEEVVENLSLIAEQVLTSGRCYWAGQAKGIARRKMMVVSRIYRVIASMKV